MSGGGTLSRLGWTALFALATGLVGACGSRPPDLQVTSTPLPPPPGAEVEQIVTADGVTLRAHHLRESAERVIVLLHGYNSSQDAWSGVLDDLPFAGYASVLTFDFRDHGRSDEADFETDALVHDVRAVVEWAHARGYQRVGLVGASMGAAAALAAAVDGGVDWVIALSAPAEFGQIDAVEAVTHLDIPVALIAARDDVSAADSLRQLRERLGLPFEHALIYPGNGHGVALLQSAPGGVIRQNVIALMHEWWPPDATRRTGASGQSRPYGSSSSSTLGSSSRGGLE